ncbi:hypothetical protein VTL71DRAFT_15612 [Oculimacula yallundae]|uniref:Uncharacterized protein n=1 Tax=Oculimacula yallundae TaxID=86028 RepID=A0ABR4CJF9_9HELO
MSPPEPQKVSTPLPPIPFCSELTFQQVINKVWPPQRDVDNQATSAQPRTPLPAEAAARQYPSLHELLATSRASGPMAPIREHPALMSPNTMAIADMLSPSPLPSGNKTVPLVVPTKRPGFTAINHQPALSQSNHSGFTAINHTHGPQSNLSTIQKNAKSQAVVAKESHCPGATVKNRQLYIPASQMRKAMEMQATQQRLIVAQRLCRPDSMASNQQATYPPSSFPTIERNARQQALIAKHSGVPAPVVKVDPKNPFITDHLDFIRMQCVIRQSLDKQQLNHAGFEVTKSGEAPLSGSSYLNFIKDVGLLGPGLKDLSYPDATVTMEPAIPNQASYSCSMGHVGQRIPAAQQSNHPSFTVNEEQAHPPKAKNPKVERHAVPQTPATTNSNDRGSTTNGRHTSPPLISDPEPERDMASKAQKPVPASCVPSNTNHLHNNAGSANQDLEIAPETNFAMDFGQMVLAHLASNPTMKLKVTTSGSNVSFLLAPADKTSVPTIGSQEEKELKVPTHTPTGRADQSTSNLPSPTTAKPDYSSLPPTYQISVGSSKSQSANKGLSLSIAPRKHKRGPGRSRGSFDKIKRRLKRLHRENSNSGSKSTGLINRPEVPWYLRVSEASQETTSEYMDSEISEESLDGEGRKTSEASRSDARGSLENTHEKMSNDESDPPKEITPKSRSKPCTNPLFPNLKKPTVSKASTSMVLATSEPSEQIPEDTKRKASESAREVTQKRKRQRRRWVLSEEETEKTFLVPEYDTLEQAERGLLNPETFPEERPKRRRNGGTKRRTYNVEDQVASEAGLFLSPVDKRFDLESSG